MLLHFAAFIAATVAPTADFIAHPASYAAFIAGAALLQLLHLLLRIIINCCLNHYVYFITEKNVSIVAASTTAPRAETVVSLIDIFFYWCCNCYDAVTVIHDKNDENDKHDDDDDDDDDEVDDDEDEVDDDDVDDDDDDDDVDGNDDINSMYV